MSEYVPIEDLQIHARPDGECELVLERDADGETKVLVFQIRDLADGDDVVEFVIAGNKIEEFFAAVDRLKAG